MLAGTQQIDFNDLQFDTQRPVGDWMEKLNKKEETDLQYS
jgi:hypothetical protein